MEAQLQTIQSLIERRDIKKAEVLIAKQLRGSLDGISRRALITLRARTRLLSARPDDAIDDLLSLYPSEMETPAPPHIMEMMGDCYFARFELSSVGFADRNDVLQAKQLYTTVLERWPDYQNSGWVYYQLGRVLLTIRDVDQAVSCFQEALLKPSTESALTAYCYERLGFVAFYEERSLEKALSFLNKAVDTYPAAKERAWLVQVHILRSRLLREMQNYVSALSAAQLALAVASDNGRREPGLSEALFTTAELLSKMGGREKDVINYLQQFVQVVKRPLGVDVTWSRVQEMLGDAYFSVGQYDEAVNAYLASLEFNPYHPWEVSLYYRIARCYYLKRSYDRSIEAIQRLFESARAEEQDIHDYRIYDVLGSAQFALGNYARAVEAYDAALKFAPPNAENLEKIKTYHKYAQELNQPL